MEKRRLGSLNLSVIGLGCANFGMCCDEERSMAVVHAALDGGITFFDTADVYGDMQSEVYLGRALTGCPDEVVIATKFGAAVHGHLGRAGASARWVCEAVDGSLRRLGTDYIDLYQQHVPDVTVPIEETLKALDRLVRSGKVREVGSSNFSSSQIAAAADAASARGVIGFVSAQNQLNLLERHALDDVIPACVRHGLGFLPSFPLANGMLTGKYQRGQPPPEGTRLAAFPSSWRVRMLSDRNFDLVQHAAQFAMTRGRTLTEFALAWLAAQPSVVSVIPGATTPAQVSANAAASSWALSRDDLDSFEKLLTERPGGPSI